MPRPWSRDVALCNRSETVFGLEHTLRPECALSSYFHLRPTRKNQTIFEDEDDFGCSMDAILPDAVRGNGWEAYPISDAFIACA